MTLHVQPLELWEHKFLLVKPLNLWYFVVAARVDEYATLGTCSAECSLALWSAGAVWMSSLERHLFGPSLHFSVGLLSFWYCMYELFIYFGYEPLSSHIICIHFHPFIKWFSFCQWFFFAGQKFLRLFRSHLVIYVFFFLCSRRQIQKKVELCCVSESVLPVLSSRSFMVSALSSWSLVRFELQPAGAACHLRAQASLVVEHRRQHVGSVAMARGLSCPEAYEIFPDQGSNPCPLYKLADS